MKLMKEKAAYHKPYEEDYKRQAIELVITGGRTCEQVARELDCSAYSLQRWKKQYLAEMAPVEVDGTRRTNPTLDGCAEGVVTCGLPRPGA